MGQSTLNPQCKEGIDAKSFPAAAGGIGVESRMMLADALFYQPPWVAMGTPALDYVRGGAFLFLKYILRLLPKPLDNTVYTVYNEYRE
jgi:hypothetical protein